jgi:hypothetical protein
MLVKYTFYYSSLGKEHYSPDDILHVLLCVVKRLKCQRLLIYTCKYGARLSSFSILRYFLG